MGYRFEPGASLDAEFRRIAGEQIGKAEKALGPEAGDRHVAVHEARKRCKKLRGLLRLVRDARPGFYARENARFRDLARSMSGVRDRAALIEAIDALEEHFGGEADDKAFGALRKPLQERLKRAEEADVGPAIEAALQSFGEARHRLDGFVIGRKAKESDPAIILSEGYGRTYRRAVKAMARADTTRGAGDFHELRKRMKYHAMHLQLLGPVWPEALAPFEAVAKTVAENLGRDHDFAVLRTEVAEAPDAFGSRTQVSAMLGLIDRRQTELREASLAAVRRLLAEEPDAAAARIRSLVSVAGKAAGGSGVPVAPRAARRKAA